MTAKCIATNAGRSAVALGAGLLRALLTASVVSVLAGGAVAQSLPDPTRPPAAATAPGAADAPAASGPVLQSVLITPTRRYAIISGERVALNGSFRDAKVVRISEAEVVLKTGNHSETLKLYPDVEKAVAQPPAADTVPPGKARRKPAAAPKSSKGTP